MKKTLIIILVALLLLSSGSMVLAERSLFLDISTSHWAYENVVKLTDLGIIIGYGDGTFKPNNIVQIDQFIKMTVIALGYNPDPSITGYWADPYIKKAIELKLITPYQFNNYKRGITREEMAYIGVNAYITDKVISQDNLKTVIRQSLNDYFLIGDNYKDVVLSAYQVGLLIGKGNGYYDPKGYTTRAEASTVIMRLLYPDQLKPFDFGSLASTYVTVSEYDNELGWVKREYPFYAPINDKGTPANEVISIHDKIKAIQKQDYGWFDITFNPFEQVLGTIFYPDIETTKLPTMEMLPHTDMSFIIDTLDFREGRNPYTLTVWRHPEHYSDMTTYYTYLDDRYGDFLKIYAEGLFEGEADYFLSNYKRLTNNTQQGIIQDERYVINNRNVHFSTNNGITVFVSDKK